MPILRRGPWYDVSDDDITDVGFTFDDEADPITDFSSEPFTYPVNCAFTDWASGDTWACVYKFYYGGLLPYDDGDVVGKSGRSESFTADLGLLKCVFLYQAKQDFDVDFNWSVTTDFNHGWSWEVRTLDGTTDSDSYSDVFDPDGAGTYSGTETMTLPATELGIVVCIVSTEVDSGTDLSIDFS